MDAWLILPIVFPLAIRRYDPNRASLPSYIPSLIFLISGIIVAFLDINLVVLSTFDINYWVDKDWEKEGWLVIVFTITPIRICLYY